MFGRGCAEVGAVTAQVPGAQRPCGQVHAVFVVRCSRTGCRSSIWSHPRSQVVFTMQRDVSLTVVPLQLPLRPVCTIYLLLYVCCDFFFFLRARQVRTRKDAQKQIQICSPVVSRREKKKSFVNITLEKGGLLAAARGIRWGHAEAFYQVCRQKPLVLVACRGFENILHTCVAFPEAVWAVQLAGFHASLQSAENSRDFFR